MRAAYTFFAGLVLGATIMLIYLGESGRLVPREFASAAIGEPVYAEATETVTPPGESSHAEAEPVPRTTPRLAQPESSAPQVPVRAGVLVVPVAGVARESLRPSYSEARGGGRTHEAIDIHAARGTAVLATADGTIRKLFLSRAGGITIYQESADGRLMYYYAHLDRYADGVREGNRVRAGQVLAYVGTSGNAAPDAPHLHFAIFRLPPGKEWWKGDPVDPYPLLTRG